MGREPGVVAQGEEIKGRLAVCDDPESLGLALAKVVGVAQGGQRRGFVAHQVVELGQIKRVANRVQR